MSFIETIDQTFIYYCFLFDVRLTKIIIIGIIVHYKKYTYFNEFKSEFKSNLFLNVYPFSKIQCNHYTKCVTFDNKNKKSQSRSEVPPYL